MAAMGRHEGAAERVAPPRARLLRLALGVTATLVAWGYLVFAAIDFGSRGRDGEGLGWFFLLLATVGATACLFVTLMLVGKLLAALRGEAPGPRAPGGGKRAAR